ncbi:MAG: DNA-3-methyladenine glycosylase [Candidatus Zixiibacteriota bacterium]
MKKKLDRKFYNRSTLKVARELLGKYLVVEKEGEYVSGKIVETEAYVGPDDPVSHAYRGITLRNRVMFGDPGYAYVYLTYGMHHCLNFVTERKGFPAAVLIRALEPADGIEIMKMRRKTGDPLLGQGLVLKARPEGLNPRLSLRTGSVDSNEVQPRSEHEDLRSLTNGPAKLCQALGIDRTLNGADLCSDTIYVEERGNKPTKIASSSRIGVNEGKDKKWRFYIENNKFVSK